MTLDPNTTTDEITILRPHIQSISFADALSKAGNEHRYQKRLVLLMSLQRICFGFLFTAFPFLFQQPQFQCRDSSDSDFYSCEPSPETCGLDIMPIPGSHNSLITHFGLYCNGAQHANLIKNLFTAACSVGVMVIFPLADKLGRRPGLIASYTVGAISLFFLAFAKTWWAFAIFLTLAGLGLSPYMVNSFLILNEFSGAKMRADASVIINSFWTFGQIAVGVLAYLLSNDWSSLVLLGIGLPLTILLPLTIFWTRESPMFLVSHKKYDEAKEILKTVAQTNKRELAEFEFIEEKKDKNQNSKMGPEKTYGFPDLFKYRSLRMTTLLGSFLCFVLYFNYYGTIFALDSVKVNSYVLTIVLAVAELIAYYVSGIMTKKMSRRLSFALCSIISFGANVLFVFFPVAENTDGTPYQVYMQLILSTINRFAVSIATAIAGIYINEIFPTSIRAIGSGLIVFIARLGSFVATIAISACMSIGLNPILIFGVICLPATLVSFMIKETQGLPLPESIEEDASDSKRYIKSFEFSYLYKTIQRKFSQTKNKEALMKLNESFDSDTTTASSPKIKSQGSLEAELSI